MNGKHRMKLSIVGIALASLALGGCFKQAKERLLPEDWYRLPEEGLGKKPREEKGGKLERLENELVNLLDAHQESLEALPERNPPTGGGWGLKFFMTELGVTSSGMLGTLAFKGTPSVLLIWRKQYEKAGPAPGGEEPPADLVLTGMTDDARLVTDVEPMVRSVLATGKVKDEDNLRANLQRTARDFRAWVAGLDQARTSSAWWPSRFRLDVTVEASGNVTPTGTVGGEIRLRFEWHRIMRDRLGGPFAGLAALSPRGESLRKFVEAVSRDLEELADEPKGQPKGFEAHQFRVGIGITKEGTVGVAKAKGSIAGHVYFSRNANKPKVNPRDPREAAALDAEPLLLISDREEKPAAELAATEGVLVDAGPGEVVYKIDHGKFRKHLRKAASVSRWFAGAASRSKAGRWKVYELKTGFDVGVTGEGKLATVSATAATEISYYNQGF